MRERLDIGNRVFLDEGNFEAQRDLKELYIDINQFYSSLSISFEGKSVTFKEFLVWLETDNNVTKRENFLFIKTIVEKFESNLRRVHNEVIEYRLCAFIAIWISVLEEDEEFKFF